MVKCLLAIAFILGVSGCGKTTHQTFHNSPESSPRPDPVISTEVGAGGSGVLCADANGKPISLEVLDVYEAKKRGIVMDLGGPDLSVEAKVGVALGRLSRFSPLRAQRYRGRAQDILAKAQFFQRGYLPRIGDEDPMDLAENCRLVQIATRRKPLFPQDAEFLIDDKLWKLLDRDNQAALLVHEIVYEEGDREYGHKSSRYSRALVGMMISRRLESLTLKDFFLFLGTIEFKSSDVGGLSVPTRVAGAEEPVPGTVTFNGDTLVSARMEVSFQNGDFFIRPQRYAYFGSELVLGEGLGLAVRFSRQRNLVAVQGRLRAMRDGANSPVSDRGNVLHLYSRDERTVTAFHDTGHFEMLTLEPGSQLRVVSPSGQLEITTRSCVRFDGEGRATVVAEGRACELSDLPEPRLNR